MSEVIVELSTEYADFDAFVSARSDVLWRSAWLLTGDSHRAEDLLQTALAKCWPSWDKVNASGSFEAYVRRTLFTTYAAWWRRRWNGELATDDLPERTSLEPDLALRRDLMTALGRLSRGQRAVVVLRYFEDLTEREVAEILGCSIGTVKSQASRAMQALRDSDVLKEGQ